MPSPSSSYSEPVYLACNIYLWTLEEQSAFLSGSLLPKVLELRSSQSLTELWLNRFDVRGPHLFAALKPTPGYGTHVEEALKSAFRDWLESRADPTPPGPSKEEILERHEACRGGTLCSVDRLPGFAERNSILFAPHTQSDYPYHYLQAEDWESANFWEDVTETVLWVMASLKRSVLASAIRWIAQVDAALTDDEAEAFWLYSLRRVLPGEKRLRNDEIPWELVESLTGSPKNRAIFEVAWDPAQSSAPDPTGWIRTALLENHAEARFLLLRDVVYTVLKQMGFITLRHVPLYACALLRYRPAVVP